MTEESKIIENMRIREATDGDIPLLAIHHRKMFEEIWERRGEDIDSSRFAEIEKAYIQKLQLQLQDGSCKAWVIEDEHRIIASGAISILSFVPTPQDLSSKVGYLHSMYTEKDQRNNHCANRIIKQALHFCKAKGIKRIILNASESGRPIYEKIGFRSAPETMRLLIE
ncbi:MAG: GNAT family N-acetyltransferase [Deltaproteobacteria bacterium]|nr:GNAT family N-acetyltransferase [Deltaproteobacteria bacterium]